jgi:hypothetical protein
MQAATVDKDSPLLHLQHVCCRHFYILLTCVVISAIIELNTRMHLCCTFSTFTGNHLIHSNVCCCQFYILLTCLVISAIIELNTSKGGTVLNVFVVGNDPSASNMTSLGLAISVHDLYMQSFIIIQSSPTGLIP